MLVLITYDVNTTTPEGKRRLRTVAKKCVAHGTRVQNSVFECILDNTQLKLLRHDLEQTIDTSCDTAIMSHLAGGGWIEIATSSTTPTQPTRPTSQ